MVEKVMNMPNNKKESNNRFIFDDLEFYFLSPKVKVNPSTLP